MEIKLRCLFNENKGQRNLVMKIMLLRPIKLLNKHLSVARIGLYVKQSCIILLNLRKFKRTLNNPLKRLNLTRVTYKDSVRTAQ